MEVEYFLTEAQTLEIAQKCGVAIAATQEKGVVLVTNADSPADKVNIAI